MVGNTDNYVLITYHTLFLPQQMRAHESVLSSTLLESTFCWPLQVLYKSSIYVSCSANQSHTTEFQLPDQS
jgi:hypothetical protein